MSRRFVVGENEGPGIRELGHDYRSRQISISGLENVEDHGDVPEGILEDKENLKKLELEWKGDAGDSSQVQELLKRLRPHRQIECICIRGYSGTEFPNWVGDPSFSNLKEMHLDGCNNLISLPPLGQLPSLERLSINCQELLVINRPEFYGRQQPRERTFSSLKTLKFRDMKNWAEWNSSWDGAFPVLEELELCDCPELTLLPEEHLPRLKRLRISGCRQLDFNNLLTTSRHLETINFRASENVELRSSLTWFFITDFSSSLTSFTLWGCSKLEAFPGGERRSCPSLEELELGDCPELKSVHIDLPRLKRLQISGCGQLDFENLINMSAALETIDIRHSEKKCMSLSSKSHLKKLLYLSSSLKELVLDRCPELTYVLSGLPSLKRLRITGCGRLNFENWLSSTCATLETLDLWGWEEGEFLTSGVGLSALNRTSRYSWECSNLLSLGRLLDSCPYLQELELINCPNLTSVPSNLPRLKILRIKGCGRLYLENVLISACATLETLDIRGWEGVKFLTNGVGLSCPSLTSITIRKCSYLETFGGGLDSCPCLQKLKLSNCPKLMSVPSNLPSLKQLRIKRCGELDLENVLISARAALETIYLLACQKVTCIPLETFPNLKVLDVRWFLNLESLGPIATTTGTSDPLPSPSLTSLSIRDCYELVSFPRGGLDAPNLESLVLWQCWELKQLPQGMHRLLPSLKELSIISCRKIESLPDGGLPSSLSLLRIHNCPLLEKWCEANGILFRHSALIE